MTASTGVIQEGRVALAGCGVIYTVPSVDRGANFAVDSSTDFDVEVVTLTPESARAANLESYVPPRLPLAFQPEAVARIAKRASEPAALPPLPGPTALAQTRPASLDLRFPPRLEPQPYRIGVADALVLAVTSTANSVEALPGLISAQSKRNDYVVQDDGAIAIPDVGRVRVAGLTLQDAEAAIFQALVRSGIDPSFSLEIAGFNSQRVTVAGLVGRPSLVPITLKPLYLHEAIGIAGGVAAPEPESSTVRLHRRDQVYQIPLEHFRTDPAARDVLLRDGDTVVVASDYRPDAAAVRFEQQLALHQNRLAVTDHQLRVSELEQRREETARARLEGERERFMDRVELGAVERPNAYLVGEIGQAKRVPLPFERAATLADALFDDVQLPIRSADFAEIYVLRAETDPALAGGLTAYRLNADNAVNLALASQMELRPNDVIFVAEQPITSWNRAISQILPNLFFSVANLTNGGV